MEQQFLDLMRQVQKLQRQVDGLVRPETSRWIDWTPTITQSGSVSATISYARYIIIDNAVIVEARLAITGSGTAGNAIVIGGQPAAIQHANTNSVTSIIGTAIVLDSGTAFYHGGLIAIGATDWEIAMDGRGNFLGLTPSIALASGDAIGFQAAYEV